MCRRFSCAVALLIGVVVALSNLTWAERAQEKEIEALTSATYVDMAIDLVVVERDDVNGTPLVPGNSERMREVARYKRGGIVKVCLDESGNRTARVVGKSKNPVIWFASRAQADLILHDGPTPWALVQGSEGSGKTTVLAMWTAFRVLEHIGHQREIGITAPTHARLAHVKREIVRYWPARWFRFSEKYQRYTFLAGPTVQLVSAVQRSEEAGSPIQGANWVAHAGDEFQDHHSREADIIARGRSAPNGRYLRLNTSTFKDSTAWRDFRAECDKNPTDWHVSLLFGLDSPFIAPSHWERFRRGVTLREYQRRVLAMDVGPERQLYYAWRRSVVENGNGTERKVPGNLRTLPVGAVDVTARELSRWGRNRTVLIGHDPGKRQHVSLFLKAYEFRGETRRDALGRTIAPLVRWFVVDEITSPECTVEAHVAIVKAKCRDRFHCFGTDFRGRQSDEMTQPLVRIDPHTNSGAEHPDRTVYSQWRAAGFQTLAAAYGPEQKPTPIKVEARVDLLNTLLCNVDEERRLFVLDTDHGPAAKELVKALETMERNEQGDAEWERKDASDRSHWPSAVAFALWTIEKPRVDSWRSREAVA